MSTGFDKLLISIANEGVELSPEDVADALWLATRLIDIAEYKRPQTTSIPKNEPKQITQPNISHEEQPATETRRLSNRHETDDFYQRRATTTAQTANLYAYGEGGKKRGYAIGISGVPMLPQMLEMERALRPLARRKPSKRTWVVDELATANFIASSDIWNIIRRPSEERWLEAVLLIEQSPTMRIWQETLREFQQLLWRTGAFSWMDTLHIDAFGPSPRLTSPMDNRQDKNPNSIINTNSSRMIVLCTDCLSDAWLSGKIPDWLSLWEKKHPSIVLQVLPDHMWMRTSLRNAKFVTGSTILPVSAPRSSEGELNKANQVRPVPIIPLFPESLQDLAKFIIAAPGNQITCYRNDPSDFREIPLGFLDSPDEYFQLDENSGLEIFENFKETVSPITLDLARYLAIVPLFLPIMRLIQQTFIPNSQPANLAELFNSGILYRLSNSSVGENLNQIEYDFLPGIRDELLGQGSKPRIREVWEVLSNYLNERFERGFDFLSILHDPTSTQEFTSGIRDESQRPFARVGANILRRLGSEYTGAANYLDDIAEFGYSNIQEPNIRESYDESNTPLVEEKAKTVRQRPPRPRMSTGYDDAYLLARKRIDEALHINAKELSLAGMGLTILPESLGQLRHLQLLDLRDNYLAILPAWLGQLTNLQSLNISNNNFSGIVDELHKLVELTSLDLSFNDVRILSSEIGQLTNLVSLDVSNNLLVSIPESLGQLTQLRFLKLTENSIADIPSTLLNLTMLDNLDLSDNPLNPELAEAYRQGLDEIKAYLRTKTDTQITLNEAKLMLVGEGGVGKTSLMDALLDKPWLEHPTTHGIEIQSFKVTNPYTRKEIILNGWDFGGQRVYRPTHQLFFSAPAVYLVVWKPREGPQQGFVKEWIQLVKRRESSAKILVVATHGGPQRRQPDIDRQELWDTFGKDTIVDFFFVDSKPDAQGHRKGIAELKEAIARVAATLPEVGRSVPKSFADVRAALQARGVPYLPLDEVLAICRAHNMDDEIAHLFITISHRLGHLTHYENDPALRDIVILRPDWLASAMSYVLDDEETRKAHGLVRLSRLNQIWDDPKREADTRYPITLHRIFLRLMERFDLSYRVAGLSKDEDSNPVSLIAQLVPDTTPKEDDFIKAWSPTLATGDIQQTQICRIVDAANGQSANAEGLFFQLIVRLHKYSLGSVNYNNSVHWQRGLVLDADYNGRALLRHIGNDVHITVRAAFPERFLGMLTEEVKYLVESFWEGLRCDITVPCIATPECRGLFEVNKLIENKKLNRHEQPCPICNEWQSIEQLLSNAPAATQAVSLDVLMKEFSQVKDKLNEVDDSTRRILSQVDKQYADLIQLFPDEAKEGPRLFSLFPLDSNKFNPKNWIRHQFRLVLWCEHSRLPLPVLNNGDMKKGVYDFELDQDWFKKAAPYLKLVTGTLSLVLPVASSTLKVANDAATKKLQDQIGLGKDFIDAIAGESATFNEFSSVIDSANLERGVGSRAENATLRELHALLKAKDPGFGGLVRVLNKRNEFLWVHQRFADEY